MSKATRKGSWEPMARSFAAGVGQEVMLARANLGLSRRATARLARVSPSTFQRVEDGDPRLSINTVARVAACVGLKLWAKAFPVQTPRLRDTGQLAIAELLRSMAATSFRVVIELGLGNGRSADLVLFGPTEIVHVEIERVLHDFQAQYRAAVAKRDEIAAAHQRPVRLVLAVEDTRRNRAALGEHQVLLRSVLPATSREVLKALRGGQLIDRDGLVWVRRR